MQTQDPGIWAWQGKASSGICVSLAAPLSSKQGSQEQAGFQAQAGGALGRERLALGCCTPGRRWDSVASSQAREAAVEGASEGPWLAGIWLSVSPPPHLGRRFSGPPRLGPSTWPCWPKAHIFHDVLQ